MIFMCCATCTYMSDSVLYIDPKLRKQILFILPAVTGLCEVYSAQLSVAFLLTSAAFPSMEQWKSCDCSKVVPWRPLCLFPPVSDCLRHVSIFAEPNPNVLLNEIQLSKADMFEIFTHGVDVNILFTFYDFQFHIF